MSKYLIYILSDPRTGEVRYVGKSCSGLRRPQQHCRPGTLSRDTNTWKVNWIHSLLKQGLRPNIEVVEELSSSLTLAEAECFWITQFHGWGFRLTNLTSGGDGGLCGYKHLPETRAKIGAANKGKKKPHLVELNRSRKGHPSKFKGVSHKGTPHTDESKIRISLSHGGRPFYDQHGRKYTSLREAAKILDLHHPNVLMVLKGKAPSTGGYVFTYLESK